MSLKHLIIHGCGGHARSVADVAMSAHIQQITFVDRHAQESEKIFGFPVLKIYNEAQQYSSWHHVAIGNLEKKAEIFTQLFNSQEDITSIISPQAYIGQEVKLGVGVFIGHGAHVGPLAYIGNNSMINTHAVIEHESRLGAHSHIAINATIAGRCQIGNFVFIGAGATIIDGITICDQVIIGAGAVVVSHITEPGLYVGVPARKKTDSQA